MGTSGSAGGTGAIATVSGLGTSYNVGGYGARGIEGQIMACVFKALVSRLVGFAKQLKMQENVNLYCDVRQLMTYVKEAHGGIFRRVALSGILDSADRPNKRCNSNVQTTRVIRLVNINTHCVREILFKIHRHLFRYFCLNFQIWLSESN